MSNKNKDENINRQRIIALLSKKETEFLDKLGMDSLFSTGSKLSRVEIINALVNAAIALDISAQGIRSKQELIQRIIDAIHSHRDKRKYPRLKKNLIVRLRKIESLEQYEHGATEDIGIGGFRIDVAFLGKPLLVNQTIEVSMNEPQEKTVPIKTIGRVAWIKEKEDRHSHEIGVMLTYMRKQDRGRFLEYLGEDADEAPDEKRVK